METNSKGTRKPNPVEKTNFLSEITFSYMFPIFKQTYQHGFSESDLFAPLPSHKSSTLGDQLERFWKQEDKRHKKYALHVALLKMFAPSLILTAFFRLIDVCSWVFIMPHVVGKIVSYYEDGQTKITSEQLDLYCLALLGFLYFNAGHFHPSVMAMTHTCMKMRIACSSLIYRKALKLSRTAMANTTAGQLVNFLSNDVRKFDESFLLCHFIWASPVQFFVATFLLYRKFGVSAIFGVLFIIMFVPIQIFIGKKFSSVRKKIAVRSDERVRLMNEIISGIQVIKMYCWEKPFASLVADSRRREMSAIKTRAILQGLFFSFAFYVSRISVFISILTYVLAGHYISAEGVFILSAMHNAIKMPLTTLFSKSVTGLAELNISIKRIQTFLRYDEYSHSLYQSNMKSTFGKYDGMVHKKNNEHLIIANEEEVVPKLELRKIYAKWIKTSPDHDLKNVSMTVNQNQLVAIVGPVGSGKSSLINVILKELFISGGEMEIQGVISYASQEVWLFSGSIRQNILFGEEFDADRYENVIKICALQTDFDILPYGDQTLVGERGKMLSGGQKARIGLARAVYKKADIYLLDDPLSAVDPEVGKHLYKECIEEFLNDKIRVLVTHQLQHLRNAHHIVLMKEGKIEKEGTFSDLQTSGMDFTKLFEQYNTEVEEKEIQVDNNEDILTVSSESDFEGPEVQAEEMAKGGLRLKVYGKYAKAGGGCCKMFGLLVIFLLTACFTYGGDFFVSYWVNLEKNLDKEEITYIDADLGNGSLSRKDIIYIYSGFVGGTFVTAIIWAISFFLFFISSSTVLHNNTFSKMIEATMGFFNKHSSGSILNRFSKDMGIVDEYLPLVMYEVIYAVLLMAGIFTLSLIVEIYLIFPMIFLGILLYLFRKVYIKTSRTVKRIESVVRSPIFNHMTTSVSGMATIRAFGAEKILIEEFDKIQDVHSAAWFLFIASNRCFAYWLDVGCFAFIGISIFTMTKLGTHINGGNIGLIITQYIDLIGNLQWCMRQWSEMENQMISVERILEYEKIDNEPKRPKSDLPEDWPTEGKIRFKNVSLKYDKEGAYVLDNLNFTVASKEKIGIVGRTGAGKSSTISALFQLYDLEGSIIIDNIDTSLIPLEDVRTKISIIPQEPVLFSGTMRKNLDPFDEYDDNVLWNALEQVELKDQIADQDVGLDVKVAEGGSNFSVGQRQLICLARALIRNNKIMVLDEATANVDPSTDFLIQKTIRNKFSDCTVLTIAHRLNTVMDSDKILVMDKGQVAEFDYPHNLLKNKDGVLYKLVQTTGTSTTKVLMDIAQKSYEEKVDTTRM